MDVGPAGDLARALSGARGLVLAVSGGPDSTALMVLVADWTVRPPVLVVSVDHGLRPEAAAETAQVAANAARLGLPSRILRCEGLLPGGNVQARAREARYACLARAAMEAGFDTIVTAHHRDDQAETFLLRLARGSGVYGLGAMRAESRLGNIRLVRPLLGRSRAELGAVLAGTGLPIATDPSNADEKFDRVRMRGIMPVLAEHGLNAARLAETAGRLARAAAALDELAASIIAEHFEADRFGVVRGDPGALLRAHPEIGLRALSRLIAAAAGADYGPDLERVEAVLAAIPRGGAGGPWRRTLHGAVITCSAREIAFWREWGRAGLEGVAARAGESIVWDGRFRVAVPRLGDALSVGPLGDAGRGLSLAPTDRTALRTLPGLYAEERLVAVPAGVVPLDAETAAPTLLETVCIVPERLGLAAVAET